MEVTEFKEKLMDYCNSINAMFSISGNGKEFTIKISKHDTSCNLIHKEKIVEISNLKEEFENLKKSMNLYFTDKNKTE